MRCSRQTLKTCQNNQLPVVWSSAATRGICNISLTTLILVDRCVYFRPFQYDTRYQEMLKDMNRTNRSEEIESVTTVDLGGWFALLSHGKWICITIVKVSNPSFWEWEKQSLPTAIPMLCAHTNHADRICCTASKIGTT
jgi:hypothetical protein